MDLANRSTVTAIHWSIEMRSMTPLERRRTEHMQLFVTQQADRTARARTSSQASH